MPLTPPVVILADGAFPTHPYPLSTLHSAGTLICCDGAANQLLGQVREPDVIVGDLDSISAKARTAFQDRLVELPSQVSSDLEKAIRWVTLQGTEEVILVGAVGLRDDHSLGNLLTLWTNFEIDISLLTDTGRFTVVRADRVFTSYKGQDVALFPDSINVRITTSGLKYPLQDTTMEAIHKGTSNCSTGASFSVEVRGGILLVFQAYPVQD
jgi:thiamine pyrophosphokinase